jgi:hypothetical protein
VVAIFKLAKLLSTQMKYWVQAVKEHLCLSEYFTHAFVFYIKHVLIGFGTTKVQRP